MATPENSFQLGILPERKIDKRAVATGYLIVALATFFLVNVGLISPDRLQLTAYRVTPLVPLPAMRPERRPRNGKVFKPKMLPAVAFFKSPKLILPRQLHLVSHTPEPVEAPKVVINQFATPQIKISPDAPHPKLLHTGDFSGSSVAPTVNAAIQKVQTGGFGDPNGLKGTGKPNAKLYAAQAGSFDLPVGPGQGNGSGGATGIKGTVASADFGSGIATPARGNGSSGSAVSTGGFGAEQVVHSGPKFAQADLGPATIPVEITYKPQPVYTEEARNLKLEGEVLLEVSFRANGVLQVNRVVRGLGHGLDEAAVAAANKMRFKPALRMGQPVDSTAVVHVLFQMAY